MGKTVTVPEKSLFLSLETTTTGLVLEISFPTTGSRTARQISPLLIFIPSLQVGRFEFFGNGLTLLVSNFITFFQHFLEFFVLDPFNSFFPGFSDEMAFFSGP